MTVAIAVRHADQVFLCADTATVLGDSVVQADDKVTDLTLDGVHLVVVLAGSGGALEAATRWLEAPPRARASEPSRGLQRLAKTLARIFKRFEDDPDSALEALVVQGMHIYVWAAGGLVGPTEIATVGQGGTAAEVAYHALMSYVHADPAWAIVSAMRACYNHCDGVLGGPGRVRTFEEVR